MPVASATYYSTSVLISEQKNVTKLGTDFTVLGGTSFGSEISTDHQGMTSTVCAVHHHILPIQNTWV